MSPKINEAKFLKLFLAQNVGLRGDEHLRKCATCDDNDGKNDAAELLL